MESIYGPRGRPTEQLTARARILDAALAQFAAHGFARATMKGIADAAEVSVGLVQHHFGTKDGLRASCDEAVLQVLLHDKLKATADESIGDRQVMAALLQAAPPLLRYLARGLIDGSPAFVEIFDRLVSGAEEFLSSQWPERFPPGAQRTRDAAALLGAMNGGTVVLHPLVARRLGLDPWADISSPRLGLAMLDVYGALGEYVASTVGQEMRESIADARGPLSQEPAEEDGP